MFVVSCGRGRAGATHGRHSSPELWDGSQAEPIPDTEPGSGLTQALEDPSPVGC